MIVVKPITIIDAILDSSTIAEPDSGETTWIAGTYNLGDQRIQIATHRIYEVVADPSTTDDPTGANQGINADPATWIDAGPTNKWAMFDNINSTASTEATQLVVEITPAELFNAVAGFQIFDVTDINVTVDDPVAGEVYNTDVDMVDNSEVIDWYYYFFSPIIRASSFALLDLPAYPNATMTLTVDGGSAIEFGNFIIGSQLTLGVANYGTSVQLLDYSRVETDTFGNKVVTPGRTSKLVNYNVTVLRSKVNYVFDTLSSLTGIPSVWIGGSGGTDDATLVFGYYRDFQDNISSPLITDATLTIEGVV